MKKILFFLSLVGSLKADFIALKKIKDPQKGKTLYFLYDIHASLEKNPMRPEEYRKHLEQLNGEISRLFQLAQAELGDRDIELQYTSLTKQYAERFKQKHLPFLYKQQKELLTLVKKCGLSLINEEWEDPSIEDDYIADSKGELYSLLGQRRGKVRIPVTPMMGLSKKLFGDYTRLVFKEVPGTKDAYYYNVDTRSGSSVDPSINANKIDDAIIFAITTLFDQKNKNEIIVAAGASHCARIINLFVEKGYQQSNLVINRKLRTWLPSEVNTIVDRLKENKDPQLEKLKDSTISQFAAYPLDLATIFAKELPACKLSTDTLETFELEISDFIKGLFK